MDMNLIQRLAAIKAKASEADPKSIDTMTDAIGTDDPDIQKLVEKIMSKMDAKDGAGKYHTAARRKAAVAQVFAMVKKAFGEMPPDDPMAADPMAPPAGSPAAAAPATPAPGMLDPAMGPADPMGGAAPPIDPMAGADALATESKGFGDPALDALVEVIKLLIKKDMGGGVDDDPMGGGVPPLPIGGDVGGGAPPPFGDEGGVEEAAPVFGGPDETGGADEGGGDDAGFPPKSDDGGGDEGGSDDEKPAKKEKSDDKKEKSDDNDDDDGDDKKVEAEAELFLLRRKITSSKNELNALHRVKGLISLSPAERAVKAAQFRKMADWMESGDEDDKPEKDAELGKAGALEGGKNDEKYTAKADPKEEFEKAEELNKESSQDDRKTKVLAHLAKLRVQKQANVYGKDMATPKEVPSPDGTTEDQLHGDAKVQYSNALGGENSEVFTKRQTIPSSETHKDMAVMYHGDNPEAAQTVQTKDDSSPDVNNKRTLKDMGTAVMSDTPKSPTEWMEKGKGTHQEEKTWEKAKSESDITPHGSRLVGLAAECALRAVKLARLAEAKGMISTEAQFDELVEKYASYDDTKYAIAKEVIDEAPSRTAAKKVVADNSVVEDYEGVTDAEESSPETPSDKFNDKKEAAAKAIKSAAAGLQRPISLSESRISSNSRFAALNDMAWSLIPTTDDTE